MPYTPMDGCYCLECDAARGLNRPHASSTVRNQMPTNGLTLTDAAARAGVGGRINFGTADMPHDVIEMPSGEVGLRCPGMNPMRLSSWVQDARWHVIAQSPDAAEQFPMDLPVFVDLFTALERA